MRPRHFFVLLLVGFSCVGLFAQDLKYLIYDTDLVPGSVYRARRDTLMSKLDPHSVAVFSAAPMRVRNADIDYLYRQDDNFYYLTGFPEPNSVLVLFPSGFTLSDPKDSSISVTTKEILFVQPRNAQTERWTGRRYGDEGARSVLGFHYATTYDRFKTVFPQIVASLGDKKMLYAPTFRQDFTGPIARIVQPLKAMVDAKDSLGLEIKDPTMIVRDMRRVKSPQEVALISKACRISALAQREAMKSCRPGMHEYELQAVYESVYLKMGAEYTAYPCIVGSGENSVVLHYESNRRLMKSGDIVVADCGSEYHNYASDITRTFPVNGRFTSAQRSIYQIVLEAQKSALGMLKPGVRFAAVSAHVDSVIERGLFSLGIIKSKGNLEFRKYYNHGLGHAVGLDVHDVGTDLLEPGIVYTVEPGIYVPDGSESVDPRFYNIGVRIEDTVLITQDGYRNLSQDAPKEIREIESLMKPAGKGKSGLE